MQLASYILNVTRTQRRKEGSIVAEGEEAEVEACG